MAGVDLIDADALSRAKKYDYRSKFYIAALRKAQSGQDAHQSTVTVDNVVQPGQNDNIQIMSNGEDQKPIDKACLRQAQKQDSFCKDIAKVVNNKDSGNRISKNIRHIAVKCMFKNGILVFCNHYNWRILNDISESMHYCPMNTCHLSICWTQITLTIGQLSAPVHQWYLSTMFI